jgi:parvulin-like peptidyl-prolyl isomerase
MKSRHILASVAFLTVVFGFSACQDAGGKIQGWIQSLAQRLRPGTPVSPNDPVLAKVGSEEIRESDLINYFHTTFGLEPLAKLPDGNRQILQRLVFDMQISQAARKAGIPSDPAYQAATKRDDDRRLQKFYLDRLRSEIMVSSADLRAYYDAHPQEFTEGILHASHIVTKTHEDAEKARTQLQKGVPFDMVAKTFSIDKISAKTGGRMSPMHTGQPAPEFERVFMTLNLGQISAITKTPAGFELIRKDAEITGPLKPFASASVQDLIRAQLVGQAFGQRVAAARAATPVVIDEARVKSLKLTPP